MDTNQDELDALKKEVDYWKTTTQYLAECHLASTYQVFAKASSSAASKRRHTSILETSVAFLRKQKAPYGVSIRNTDELLATIDEFLKLRGTRAT